MNRATLVAGHPASPFLVLGRRSFGKDLSEHGQNGLLSLPAQFPESLYQPDLINGLPFPFIRVPVAQAGGPCIEKPIVPSFRHLRKLIVPPVPRAS